MRYPITLIPQGVIPRDPNLTFRIPRVSTAGAAGAVAAATTMHPGNDIWYTVGANARIPYAEYVDRMLGATLQTEFTPDDDYDSEEDIPGGVLAAFPCASAWWQLLVPELVTAYLTADTWLSTGGLLKPAGLGGGPALYPTDTTLMILSTAEPLPLGAGIGDNPLPTVLTDFADLVVIASSDDDPDPADLTRPYLSKVTNVALAGGKVYWVRVDTYGGSGDGAQNYPDGMTYRVRLSLHE